MSFIILIPGLLTLVLAALKGWRVALVYGLLPTLVFFPNFYIFKIQGVPELTFWSGSMLALLGFWIAERGWRGMKFEVLDLVVFAYVLWCLTAEHAANGSKESQNLFGKLALGTLAPYFIGRSLRQDPQLLWNCTKALVVFAAFLFLLAPYEARMGKNPFDLLRSLIPSNDWEGVLYRNGARRVCGSFSHSICYGYFAMMMLPFSIWLHMTRSFASQWRSAAVIFLCLVGLALSGSRGAALGAAIAVSAMGILWSPHRKVLMPLGAAAALAVVFLIMPALQELMVMKKNEGSSESAQTAAYRAEMIRDYVEVCDRSPWLGYGRGNVPVVSNIKSIDNQYLWLSLNYGFPAALLLLLSAGVGVCMQLPSVLLRDPKNPWSRFDAALIGLLVGAMGVQATVFAGTQSEQFFFLFVGLASSPKVVALELKQAALKEIPAMAGGALYAKTRADWNWGWWRRVMIDARAEHGPVTAVATSARTATAGGFCATCENCKCYPPYEKSAKSGWWFVRLYRWIFRRETQQPKFKAICKNCRLNPERMLIGRDDSKHDPIA